MPAVDYERMLEDFYTRLLGRGDTCVDVGAHLGRHSLPIARHVGLEGKVYAFEPIPDICRKLEESVIAEKLSPTVEVHRCALSDQTAEADFVLVHEAPGYSGLRPRHYDAAVTTETIRVHTQRLDDYLPIRQRRVRYIKIDCEGGELKVLRGAVELLRRDRPVISFECGDNSLVSYDYNSGDIYDFFDEYGYGIESIMRAKMGRVDFTDATAKQEFWDYLAFPN